MTEIQNPKQIDLEGLVHEATEFTNIFGSILLKSE